MDRKGVHILFCDHDSSGGSGTLALLQKCSYKVTVVKSARQVIETLKSEKAEVDIILSDVELPQEKGFRMLKHIMRQEKLGHIPVVVMSERDETDVVAKCLRLGAVDYLVKPLRLNELMNLWTHMWRRRRTLGLPDKHALHGSFNFPFNSSISKKTTDFLSDKKDKECPIPATDFNSLISKKTTDFLSDKKDKECPIPAIDTGPPIDLRAAISPQLELSLRLSSNYNVKKLPEQALDSAPSPKERVGHSSAFATYSKTSNQQPSEQSANVSPSWAGNLNNKSSTKIRDSALRASTNTDAFHESTNDTSMVDENRSGDLESQICDAPCQDIPPVQHNVAVERIFHAGQIPAAHGQNYQHHHGFMESPPADMWQGFTANLQQVCAASSKQGGFLNSTMCSPQATILQPPYHYEAGMVNVPAMPNVCLYYPLAHMALPQFIGFSTWPALMNAAPMVGGKMMQAERREAAVYKFRMKRKDRCFEKKIRYVSRKKLAEKRPRVRGQFVRRTIAMGLAESPAIGLAESPAIGNGYVDEEEGKADDEQGCSEQNNYSSPECMDESCRVA